MVRDTKLYDTLGVHYTATETEIKKAFKKLALVHHPDKNGGDDTQFKEIDAAYKILSNKSSRDYYDKTGSTNVNNNANGGDPFNPFDVFSHFTNFFNSNEPRQTRDLIYNLQETLANLYTGIKKTLRIKRQVLCLTCKGMGGKNVQVCKRCNGNGIILQQQQRGPVCIQTQQPCATCSASGKIILEKCEICTGSGYQQKEEQVQIEIPAGAKDGYVITIIGMANEAKDVKTGNLKVVIKELADPTFKRNNNNIHIDTEIPLVTALLGGTLDIAHIDNTTLQVDIPKGRVIKPSDHLVIENKGMPILGQSDTFGDFIITFNVVFPSNEWAKKANKDLVSQVLQ